MSTQENMNTTDLYRIRDFVPDFDAISAEYEERSLALTARTKVQADVAYGTSAREVLDIIFPAQALSGAPLHVFVHGGYWRSGEKANYRFMAEPVLAAGGIAALVEYDLMPSERLPVLVNQVRRAVQWLQTHASELGADPARITVSGHSAGAHLSSYLAAKGPQESSDPALPNLKGLLLLSGIYDLSDIPGSFLRNEAQMTDAEAKAWSPLTSAHQSLETPRIIAYGEDETQPFHEQAQALHKLLGAPSQLLPVPGCNHMNIVLDLANPDGQLGRVLADMTAG